MKYSLISYVRLLHLQLLIPTTASMKFIGPEAATVAMGTLVVVVAVEVTDTEGVVDSEVMDVDEEEDMHVAERVDAAQMSPKMLHLTLSHR
jgi:hypothetical protein